MKRVKWQTKWLMLVTASITSLTSCKVNEPYIGVVIEKTQPYSQIQTVILGTDSLHYVYPSLTIEERDSLELGDTIKIDKQTLKIWHKNGYR